MDAAPPVIYAGIHEAIPAESKRRKAAACKRLRKSADTGRLKSVFIPINGAVRDADITRSRNYLTVDVF